MCDTLPTDSPGAPNLVEQGDRSLDSGPRKKRRRAQYALRACDNCRSRKVKCCGKLPCKRCIDRSENCAFQLSERPEVYQIAGGVFSDGVQRSESTVELHKRVVELELEIGRLKMMAEETESSESPELPFPGEPDTFQLNNCALNSKFQALLDAIPDCSPSPPALTSDPADIPEPVPTKSRIRLPEPKILHNLLSLYFTCMNPYYPCISRPTFEDRLLHILRKSQYPKGGLEIRLCSQDVIFMALVAAVLAQAQHFQQEESGTDHSIRDWEYYHQSRTLIRTQRRKGEELDLIRVHIVCSMYLVQKERLAEACQMVVMAIAIAQGFGLHDQTSWPKDMPPAERVARKCLFWTIYYQDRRVAEKLGQPYFLRDSEIGVEDFSNERQDTADYCNLAYMQLSTEWGQLWGEVWESFFAIGARKKTERESFALMDSRVMQVIQKLPSDLVFSPHHVALYAVLGDFRARYRLLSFMRLQLLRLIIHHNPIVGLPPDTDGLVLILDLASEIITGICSYLSVFPDSKYHIGVVAIAGLVDCICHLVPPLLKLHRVKYEGKATSEGISALRRAQTVLQMLAETSAAASRAVQILQPVFSVLDKTFPTSNYEFLPAEDGTSSTAFESKWQDFRVSSSLAQDSQDWDMGVLEGLGGVLTPSFDLSRESWLDLSENFFNVDPMAL